MLRTGTMASLVDSAVIRASFIRASTFLYSSERDEEMVIVSRLGLIVKGEQADCKCRARDA